MRIVTKGKGLEEWSDVFGYMRIDSINPLSIKFDFKDEDGMHQLIIEFTNHETKRLKEALSEVIEE